MNGLQIDRFSTDSYPVHERVAAWSEAIGRHCGVRIDVSPRSADDFWSNARIARLSTLGLVEGSTSPVCQGNARGLIVNDDVTFVGVMTSRWGTSQLGRSLDLHPGDWSLLSNSDVSEITIPEASRYLAFSVPRAALKPLVPDIGATFAHRIPASSPALQMLVRYLDLVQRDNVVTTPELAATFADHVCDLLAFALGPTRDAREQARGSVAAARLRQAVAHIGRHFVDPDLTIASVARAQNISPRYLQELFEQSGASFTARVNELRLKRAFSLLTRFPDRPVSDIVAQVGFSNVSHFNRLFRARFGESPSGVRGT